MASQSSMASPRLGPPPPLRLKPFFSSNMEGLFHHADTRRFRKDLHISLAVFSWHQGGRRSCCRRVPCLGGAAGQQQQAGCPVPGGHSRILFAKFDGGIPQREWRMVAQALSVPRYDFAMAHIPTSRLADPQIQQELINPLTGWTQARYARSHRVQV